MKRFAYIPVILALCTLLAGADPRVDLTTYRTKEGQQMALYTLSQGPGPFVLLDRVPGAIFLGPNRWAVPVPAGGLPVLRFRVGNQLHTAPAVSCV